MQCSSLMLMKNNQSKLRKLVGDNDFLQRDVGETQLQALRNAANVPLRKILKSGETLQIGNNDVVTATISHVQGKHIRIDPQYINNSKQGGKRSYLLDGTNPQLLLNMYRGTGTIIRKQGNSEWSKREVVESNQIIGYYVDKVTGRRTQQLDLQFTMVKQVRILF